MREKDYRMYFQDILEAIKRINQYLEGLTFEQFSKDNKTVDAVKKEAAKNIPAKVKREHPEIAWKRMSGMRDKLIHEYFGVDLQIIWDTSKIDLVASKPLLERLLQQTERE